MKINFKKIHFHLDDNYEVDYEVDENSDEETQSKPSRSFRSKSRESLHADENRMHTSPITTRLKNKSSQVSTIKSRESINLEKNKINNSKKPESKKSQVKFSMTTDDEADEDEVDFSSKKSNSSLEIPKPASVLKKSKSATKNSSAKDFEEMVRIHNKKNSKIPKEALSLQTSAAIRNNRRSSKVVSDDEDEDDEIKLPRLRSTSRETKKTSTIKSSLSKVAQKTSQTKVENDQLSQVKGKKTNKKYQYEDESEQDDENVHEKMQPKRRGRPPKSSSMTEKVAPKTSSNKRSITSNKGAVRRQESEESVQAKPVVKRGKSRDMHEKEEDGKNIVSKAKVEKKSTPKKTGNQLVSPVRKSTPKKTETDDKFISPRTLRSGRRY